MSKIEQRLRDLNVVLPAPTTPMANYAPYVVAGDFVYVSGQISAGPEGVIRGKLGEDLAIDAGIKAARACATHLLAQLKAAVGDLDRVRRVVKLTGFVNSTADFADHPKIMNGASDLLVEVFGEAGRHARAAVGASSLPLGAAVEIDGAFEIA
jgi:enamine deaminase RidA (YjgF/YER057c/UK114 family)